MARDERGETRAGTAERNMYSEFDSAPGAQGGSQMHRRWVKPRMKLIACRDFGEFRPSTHRGTGLKPGSRSRQVLGNRIAAHWTPNGSDATVIGRDVIKLTWRANKRV